MNTTEKDTKPRIVVGHHDENGPNKPEKAASPSMRKANLTLDSFSPGRAFMVSAMWGIVMAVVIFLVCLLMVIGMDSTGILNSVNALLGEAMQLTTGKLISMSVIMSIIIGLAVCVLKWLKLMIYNSISYLNGGLKLSTTITGGEE